MMFVIKSDNVAVICRHLTWTNEGRAQNVVIVRES